MIIMRVSIHILIDLNCITVLINVFPTSCFPLEYASYQFSIKLSCIQQLIYFVDVISLSFPSLNIH